MPKHLAVFRRPARTDMRTRCQTHPRVAGTAALRTLSRPSPAHFDRPSTMDAGAAAPLHLRGRADFPHHADNDLRSEDLVVFPAQSAGIKPKAANVAPAPSQTAAGNARRPSRIDSHSA